MERIAVLIPCLNEGKTIGKVVSDFREKLPEANIYVFDNGSTDNTSQKATEAGAIVYKVGKRGKGNVVRSMFRKIDADIYVMTDGDDTYPLSNLDEMMQPVLRGEADMVVGDRLSSTYFTENKRRFHNFGNRLMKSLINKLFNSDLQDILSGYRVFNRRFVKSINIKSDGFEIETEITAFALYHNFDIMEVTVPYKDREPGNPSKLNTIKDGTRVLKTFVKVFRDYKPFKFFSFFSFIIAIVAIVLLVPVFQAYFETGLVERFPTLIFGCFLLIASLLFFLSGIILQVIINHDSINQNP